MLTVAFWEHIVIVVLLSDCVSLDFIQFYRLDFPIEYFYYMRLNAKICVMISLFPVKLLFKLS